MAQNTPPLNTLRAFEAAARHCSFSAAAKELNVTAAAISHRIKELESALGLELFKRQSRGVILSEAGRRYLEDISLALQIIERASSQIDSHSIDGPLTVSMPQSFAANWISPRLSRLHDQFPGLELTIECTNQLVDFHESQADIGIRFGRGVYPGLDAKPLLTDAINVFASRNLELRQDTRFESLLQNSTLLEDYSVPPEEKRNTWSPWLAEAGVRANSLHRVRMSDSALTTFACSQGAGICLARMSIVYQYLLDHQLKPLRIWHPSEFSYYLVSRPGDAGNPRIATFSDWLQNEAQLFIEEVRSMFQLDLGVTKQH